MTCKFLFDAKPHSELKEYLDKIAPDLPDSARQFAMTDWSKNPSGALHDSWLEELKIDELSTGDRRQTRVKQITLRLLGSWHDGYIELRYEDVDRYSLQMAKEDIRNADIGHGDLLRDEIQLTDKKRVRHVLEFELGSMCIECGDIKYRWIPVGPSKSER